MNDLLSIGALLRQCIENSSASTNEDLATLVRPPVARLYESAARLFSNGFVHVLVAGLNGVCNSERAEPALWPRPAVSSSYTPLRSRRSKKAKFQKTFSESSSIVTGP